MRNNIGFEEELMGEVKSYVVGEGQESNIVNIEQAYIVDITEVESILKFTLDTLKEIVYTEKPNEQSNGESQSSPMLIKNEDRFIYIGYIDDYMAGRVLPDYMKFIKGAKLYRRRGDTLYKVKDTDTFSIRLNL